MNGVLTPRHQAAGLRLIEDDHTLSLARGTKVLARFSALGATPQTVLDEADKYASLKKGDEIVCPYCDTKFSHSGRVECQVCPGCGSELLL